jgi:hypothetical protein
VLSPSALSTANRGVAGREEAASVTPAVYRSPRVSPVAAGRIAAWL